MKWVCNSARNGYVTLAILVCFEYTEDMTTLMYYVWYRGISIQQSVSNSQ